MSMDIAIYIEIRSPDGKWVCANPKYPTKIGDKKFMLLMPSIGISFPRNSTFFKALSSNGEFSTYDKVIYGMPPDASAKVRSELRNECGSSLYHLYLKDFQLYPIYSEYLNTLFDELSDMYELDEALNEHTLIKLGFESLALLVCNHVESAGFPYWSDGNLDRVRIVYGFY